MVLAKVGRSIISGVAAGPWCCERSALEPSTIRLPLIPQPLAVWAALAYPYRISGKSRRCPVLGFRISSRPYLILCQQPRQCRRALYWYPALNHAAKGPGMARYVSGSEFGPIKGYGCPQLLGGTQRQSSGPAVRQRYTTSDGSFPFGLHPAQCRTNLDSAHRPPARPGG